MSSGIYFSLCAWVLFDILTTYSPSSVTKEVFAWGWEDGHECFLSSIQDMSGALSNHKSSFYLNCLFKQRLAESAWDREHFIHLSFAAWFLSTVTLHLQGIETGNCKHVLDTVSRVLEYKGSGDFL
jgi:hypothetical protein